MLLLFSTWIVLLSAVIQSSQSVHYIAPSNNSSVSCPSPPCLTIAQYAEDATNYFTNGATFVFLPGNHSVETTVNLINTHSVTLKGSENGTSYVECRGRVNFLCKNVTNLKITGLTFLLNRSGSALQILSSKGIALSRIKFMGGKNNLTRAIESENSSITIFDSWFERIQDGAIRISDASTLTLVGNTFTTNAAQYYGGAVRAHSSSLLLYGRNNFLYNTALNQGGAIYCLNCRINITGQSNFEDNTCSRKIGYTSGGAILLDHNSILSISERAFFLRNRAILGGAIRALHSKISLNGTAITFENNVAEYGGAIGMKETVALIATNSNFTHNEAQSLGGAIYIGSSNPNEDVRGLERLKISGNFVENRGECGGAISISNGHNVLLFNISIIGNSLSGLCIFDSNVTFEGTTIIASNAGEQGGGIQSIDSLLSFDGDTTMENNSAIMEGSMDIDYQNISDVLITCRNSYAHQKGGAVHATSSNIFINNIVTFESNRARYGGAMYLTASSLILAPKTVLNTSNNNAECYGGAIYHEDAMTQLQCSADTPSRRLPKCFLRPKANGKDNIPLPTISSFHNSADVEGSFLYGGLLDKCRKDRGGPDLYCLDMTEKPGSPELISSEPYTLCICTSNEIPHCRNTSSVSIYRGQSFFVNLLAIAQGGTITTAQVIATTDSHSRLKLQQSEQYIKKQCSRLKYTLFSTKSSVNLRLHLNNPCQNTPSAVATLSVKILPCPDGFQVSGEQCICEDRLQRYSASCTIDDQPSITKKTTFWMGVVYSNGSYQGLVLCSTCPSQYCRTGPLDITVDHLDTQCALNRSGVLCGACAPNRSLLLGGSKCGLCTNTHLALLLPMACAGLSLVALLTFLKLTVATGTLNSLILYANIVQVNRNMLFPKSDSANVLTVFIAWLNLDLGFETCFYDGMDAFAQTFLQFAFPVYVWLIISLIILSSQYSTLVSKLIGSNPIAVLATLLLMSYTKILKIAIDLYSSVTLEHPNDLTVTVWLKDANEPYLRSRHLFLTVVTSLVLAFLFLPYTLLLLFGSRLYRLMGRKHFHWLGRLKPILDAYYAPFNRHTRYWTGVLLLVRCALYVVFSYNSLGGTSKSLLAIVITFTAILAKVWFSGRIYKSMHVNIIEVSLHLNLVALSAVVLARVNTPAAVYSLVGVAFATMLGIMAYHFHHLYIARTAVWLKVETGLSDCFSLLLRKEPTAPVQDQHQQTSSRDPNQIVSKTVIELREPLLET